MRRYSEMPGPSRTRAPPVHAPEKPSTNTTKMPRTSSRRWRWAQRTSLGAGVTKVPGRSTWRTRSPSPSSRTLMGKSSVIRARSPAQSSRRRSGGGARLLEQLQHRRPNLGQVGAQVDQDLGRQPVPFDDDPEEEVGGAHPGLVKLVRLPHRFGEDRLGPRRQRRAGGNGLAPADDLLDPAPDRLRLHAQAVEGDPAHAFAVGEDPEQHVLGAHPSVTKGAGLLAGEDDDGAGRAPEALERPDRRRRPMWTPGEPPPTAR